jgi:hypothetical protein
VQILPAEHQPSVDSSATLERKLQHQRLAELPKSPLQLKQLPYPDDLGPTALAASDTLLAIASRKAITVMRSDSWETVRVIDHPD